MPSRFYTERNVSIYALLKETGYFELHNEISESNIYEVLIQHPECINQWLSWSEDKRSSSGWYFKQDEDGKYIVGFFPTSKDFNVNIYSDKTEACAVFIKREIEDIRDN